MRLKPMILPASLMLLACLAGAPCLEANQPASDAPAVAKMPALIDINSAGLEELQQLKGIGPALAKRIVEYREQRGPFRKIEEIMNVRGIGEKTFLRFKDRITVGNPAVHES